MKFIYLDHNSTTPLNPRAADAIRAASLEFSGNPASQHRLGQLARRRLEQSRARILADLGAVITGRSPDKLIFTSGGTEGNNLALLGMVDANRPQIVISAVEHPSIVGAAQRARQLGFSVQVVPVDQNGVVRLEVLELLLHTPTCLVSIMAANNETGVLQPIAAAAALCHQWGALLHTDAVQAVGKVPVLFREWGVDALTFTSHKFHGPRSIGGLVVRADGQVHPLLYGGFQQGGIRPGTEDVGLAVGCETALTICLGDLEQRRLLLAGLRDRFVEVLHQRLGGDFVINGGQAARAPHTLNVSFPGVERQALLLAADSVGIAISTGSACASGSSEPSPVLLAMGLDPDVVGSSVRISFGVTNTIEEVEWGAAQMAEIVAAFRQR